MPTSPPRDVSAFITESDLSISWSDPVVSASDAAIVNYTVNVFRSPTIVTDACSASNLKTSTVTKQRSISLQIQNGSSIHYSVQVAAASTQGLGPFSECISVLYSPQSAKSQIGIIAGATCGAVLGVVIFLYMIVVWIRARTRSMKYRGSRRVAASMMNEHFDLQGLLCIIVVSTINMRQMR